LTPIVLRLLGAVKSDEKLQKFHDRETLKKLVMQTVTFDTESEIAELDKYLFAAPHGARGTLREAPTRCAHRPRSGLHALILGSDRSSHHTRA
jgi:hypothetical protein